MFSAPTHKVSVIIGLAIGLLQRRPCHQPNKASWAVPCMQLSNLFIYPPCLGLVVCVRVCVRAVLREFFHDFSTIFRCSFFDHRFAAAHEAASVSHRAVPDNNLHSQLIISIA
mmetsp:Transcript_127105/g.247705  ORF Transcript_127105/g.247705 Transcript_127105/m.247705 type:complete len:113 (+) Transcript_127105:59-397(+)